MVLMQAVNCPHVVIVMFVHTVLWLGVVAFCLFGTISRQLGPWPSRN